MPVSAFISYSHADDKHLQMLHKHLAMLRREGALQAWTDHQILPGGRLDDRISTALEGSLLFLALVSPDYLASGYCYEKEFEQALRLEQAGKLTIIPIVLEPCDWLSSPLSQFMALPKDGKPVSEFTNANVAYLDVVSGIRRVVSAEASVPNVSASGAAVMSMGRRLSIKREFDSIQKSDFADKAFEAIRSYFRASCAELSSVEDLKAKFDPMSDNAFTCTVVNRAIKGGQEAHITVRNRKDGRSYFGDIDYVFQPHDSGNSSNGSIHVSSDDHNLFLQMNSYVGGGNTKYDAQQAAEDLWLKFIAQAGIAYD